MGRPREHDDETRQALLAAAERLLAESGADALSVRAVATAADTTTRAVYSVFGSKGGLLAALGTHLFELLGAAIDQVGRTDDPTDDLVRASVSGFRAVMLSHAPLYRLVFQDVVPALHDNAALGVAGDAAFARLEGLVSRLVPTGSTPATVRDAALSVHALTEGLAAVELRGMLGGPRAARRIWDSSLRAVAEGLA